MASNKRSNNFSKNEERILLEIVCIYRDIIECKKTDTVVNRKKVEVWADVAKEFNAKSGETFRDAKILKNKYENLKKRTKHKVAEERQALMRTGGGPYIDSKLDTTEQKIIDLLGVRAEGMQTEFGDDAIMPHTTAMNEQIAIDGNIVLTVQENEQDNVILEEMDSSLPSSNLPIEDVFEEADSSNKNSWAKYTPDMLRQSKSKVLNIRVTPKHKKNNLPVGDKIEKWAASEADFENVKIECFKEEHHLKMEHLKELHAKQIAILSEESEQRMGREKEKHDLEMQILRKKL